MCCQKVPVPLLPTCATRCSMNGKLFCKILFMMRLRKLLPNAMPMRNFGSPNPLICPDANSNQPVQSFFKLVDYSIGKRPKSHKNVHFYVSIVSCGGSRTVDPIFRSLLLDFPSMLLQQVLDGLKNASTSFSKCQRC